MALRLLWKVRFLSFFYHIIRKDERCGVFKYEFFGYDVSSKCFDIIGNLVSWTFILKMQVAQIFQPVFWESGRRNGPVCLGKDNNAFLQCFVSQSHDCVQEHHIQFVEDSQASQLLNKSIGFSTDSTGTYTNTLLVAKKTLGSSEKTEEPVNGATKEDIKAAETAAEVANTAEKLDSNEVKAV